MNIRHARGMSLMNKLIRFAMSPQGRKLTTRAKTYAGTAQGKRNIELARKQLAKSKRPR